MTAPGAFVAGDILGAADMNALPAGKVGHAIITSAQSTITTIVDVTSATATWTAVSSRLYRTSFFMFVSINSSTDTTWAVEFNITDASNTVKGAASSPVSFVQSRGVTGSIIETGLSGSVTRKLRAFTTNNGSGDSFNIQASSSSPCYFVVEDIGPA